MFPIGWQFGQPQPEQPKPIAFAESAFADPGLERVTDPHKPAPDLQTQFEALLHQVYDSERRERILDRCDQAARLDEERERRAKRGIRRTPEAPKP